MNSDSEPFTGTNIKSHLNALQAQIDLIKSSLSKYDEGSRRLKKQITEELITAVISRFERSEERIKKLDEKLDSINFGLREELSQEIKNIRNEISGIKMFEEKVIELEEDVNSMQFDIKERIPQEIRNIRNEISDAQLSKAVTSISQEKEIKVSAKPLDKLNKEQELFF